MKRFSQGAGVSALLLGGALLWFWRPAALDAAPPRPPTNAAPAWKPPTFRRAEGTRAWQFPRDHGQHPAYRLEWWYFTGIVRTAAGRAFGYQVTFFRQGVTRTAKPESGEAGHHKPAHGDWAVHSVYLAHVALSDLANGRFLHDSRVSRDSLGLAGAAAGRLEVWLRDWRADPLPDDPNGARLTVDAGNFALHLTLHARGQPVLNGEGGLDRKGPQPGQATWYYSQPRLATDGTVRVHGDTLAVEGSSWMDHEFGTSQLGPQLAGWDWMGLRLDDGSDLMLYRLRRTDGGASPFSGGTYVTPQGRRITLVLNGEGPGAARMSPGQTWHSPASGADYPLQWKVALPGQGLTLHIRPAMDNQEQVATRGTPFAYWEGAVWVQGTRDERPLRGDGYLELTGYAGRLGGALR